MATVSTTPRHHFYQNNGALASGGTLEIFDANTVTHAVTWNDRDGATIHQNANPLTLDSQGAAVVWLEAGKVYDWIAKDALGNTIDSSKGIIGSTSAIATASQWVVTALTPTFINTRTFTLVGDQTAIYSIGRRVRATLSGGFKYATILSSVFSTLTTITLGFATASDTLDATLSAVDVGLDVASSPSVQVGIGSVIDLTGYSGADVPLGIGQSVILDVTSATTIQARIATGDNQQYTFDINPTIGAGIATGTNSFLSPNNTSFAGAFESLINFQANTTPTSSRVTAGNTPILDAGFRVQSISGRVSTKTISKSIKTHFVNSSNTTSYQGTVGNLWNDTSTGWTSFGTFTFANAITGRITINRIS